MTQNIDNPKIVLPFTRHTRGRVNENLLQQQMFAKLEEMGLLRVKEIGATCTMSHGGQILARVVYLKPSDAKIIVEAMNEWFITHRMSQWKATTEEIQLF